MSKIPDGLALFYIKEGILYPVGMTIEQKQMFDIYMAALPGKISVIGNMPQGEARTYLT
ncbi:hypothetical protein PAECIP111891_04214 [Paenibacillus allorhizoplanae]|uniref:Uncharacterized protein n=1 Tax=Paenibacillus allorhizoplanae TaxID=2905648 RepID=A0ABM9CII4_9BACL|nr:hypothetical protein [Paenibacillus allorhizoplanae]CAH1215139.1 hypothetical protein PAECIP111891_04214 [Paenibacillus allorhizoplanae]